MMTISVTKLLDEKILMVAIMQIEHIEDVEIEEKPMLMDAELTHLLYNESDKEVDAVLKLYPPIIGALVSEYRCMQEGNPLRGKVLCLLQKLTA